MSRFDRDFDEALQAELEQSVETVTRSSRIDIVSGGIDEIDPPEDIDQYAEWSKNTAVIRANLRKFVNDVWEPGYRVEGPDQTVQYFEGDVDDISGEPPEDTPEGGFLANSFVYAGERHQDFYDGGKQATWQRWARGTVLVEYLKKDATDPESEITGFYFIRPETVYPQVENNTNILLDPDPDKLPEDITEGDYETTKRGEVAAYIQFDDESILGLRRNGFDKQQIPLSQNDVIKQTLDPDIGGDIGTAEGVFGESILSAIDDDVTEYKQIKRDRAEAIGRKAYGVWTAQFTPEVIDRGDAGIEVIEWTDDSIQDTEAELQTMGPGDVLTSDANIDLQKHEANVPELDDTLMHYVNEIETALPAPKVLASDFDEDINRDVTSDKAEDYQDIISEERNVWEETWTQAIRTVAERKGLPTEGLEFKIQPEKSDNPVKTLDSDEIDRMNTYISTLATAAGPQAGPTALVDAEDILEVLDFPVNETDPEEAIDEMATEDTEAAWRDIMGVESLQGQYEAGEWVSTPDGDGVIDDRVTEGTVDEMDASSDSPVYAVIMLDKETVNFYRASDLEQTEGPTVEDVDEPTEDLDAMADITNAVDDAEALQFGDFNYPDSWEQSETPNRVILLDAWSSMGAQFDCGGACCKGTMRQNGMSERASDQFCASMKDAATGTHDWRGGWAD